MATVQEGRACVWVAIAFAISVRRRVAEEEEEEAE